MKNRLITLAIIAILTTIYALPIGSTFAVIPDPYLTVEPSYILGGLIGSEIEVDVDIHDVDVTHQLVGVQFRLSYNATLLGFVDTTYESPFFGVPPAGWGGTEYPDVYAIIIDEYYPPYGQNVLTGLLLLPNSTGGWPAFPSGSARW